MLISKEAPVIVLVDCDSFYVSCERTRCPEARSRPVVVLSNNDGCAVSVSKEAKALGIRTGVPIHTVKQVVKHHGVLLFSPDFPFYIACSEAVLACLEQFSPFLEAYSIDEAFLDVRGIRLPKATPTLQAYARAIQHAVWEKTQIPVSVGVAATKTLAKVAVYHAKRSVKAGGVLDLYQSPYIGVALARVPIAEVWGVGRRLQRRLEREGITTALDLAQQGHAWAKRFQNKPFAQTVAELNGIPCLPLADSQADPKSLIFSRSFGMAVDSLTVLQAIAATYTRKAMEKLRAQDMLVQQITVFIRTNPYREDQPQHRNSLTILLPAPTQSTVQVAQAVVGVLPQLIQAGFGYHKLGLCLSGLSPRGAYQLPLLASAENEWRQAAVMQAMDSINQQFSVPVGGTRFATPVQLATELAARPGQWAMRQNHLGAVSGRIVAREGLSTVASPHTVQANGQAVRVRFY